MRLWRRFLDSRLVGLVVKETRQILRDKHLLFLLLFPPTIQLLLLGAVLDPGLHNVTIGIVDHARSPVSRELISAVTAGQMFRRRENLSSDTALEERLRSGQLKVGLVIPPGLDSALAREHRADVQVIVDGVDAYTARLAASCMAQKIQRFNPEGAWRLPPVVPCLATLYNPGLRSSWYFIPGIMGALLTLTSTLVASAALLREKELGTLEQLLMTPYASWEILLGKVVPIFALLMGDVLLAVILGMSVFGVPFRGSVLLFALASGLYVCVGISLGMMLATVCRTERQSHLVSFFVIVPVMQLSGSVVPFETMPPFLRAIGAADPLRYFTTIARSLLIKGAGLDSLWPSFLVLAVSVVALFLVSVIRFRRQLT